LRVLYGRECFREKLGKCVGLMYSMCENFSYNLEEKQLF